MVCAKLFTDYSYLEHFLITITTAADYNMIMCGCEPWTQRVHVSAFCCSSMAFLIPKWTFDVASSSQLNLLYTMM